TTSSASTIRDEEATVSASDRIRRPPLDRTEPIRAWSSLFGAGPLNDVVTRSVELGYRVVDEYIRQGQKAAARFGSPSLGTETMASDMQDLGVRMVQYTSDVFGLWFEMMNVMLAGGSPFRPGNGHAAPPPPADPPPPRRANPRRHDPRGVRPAHARGARRLPPAARAAAAPLRPGRRLPAARGADAPAESLHCDRPRVRRRRRGRSVLGRRARAPPQRLP